MTYFQPVTGEQASEETNKLLEHIREDLNAPVIPRFMSTLAHYSIESLKASWALNDQLILHGSLPRMLKEMIFVAISNHRQCEYCKTAHLAFCRYLGIDDEMAQYLLGNIKSIEPERVRAIIEFAIKCADSPKTCDQADIDYLKSLNVNDQEIVEIISVSAMAVYHNIISDVMRVDIDPEFGKPKKKPS